MSKILVNSFSSYEVLSEQELVIKAQMGDMLSFEILYERYQKRLMVFLTSKAGNKEAAEDLFQEALIRAWKGLASLRGPFRPWLYSIVNNVLIDYFRKSRKVYIEELDEEAMETEDVSAGPEEQTEINERLLNALAIIPRIPRTCFILYRIQGLSVAEIAKKLVLEGSILTCGSSALFVL